MCTITRIKGLLLAVVCLLALRSSVALAEESQDETRYFGMSRTQVVAVAMAVSGLAVATAAATAYYGIGAGLAALYTGHWVVEAVLIGTGAGVLQGYWSSETDTAPSEPVGPLAAASTMQH